jgi:aquaporin TIP
MAIQLGFQPQDFTIKTWRAVAAEFIATGLFVFLGAGAVVASNAWLLGREMESGLPLALEVVPSPGLVIAVALAHGLAIMVLMAAIAKISGGHINPAITFAAAITGKIKISTAALYVAGQLIAAILGALLLKGIIAAPLEHGLGVNALGPTSEPVLLLEDQVGGGAGAGLLLEAVLTFMLVFVVFATVIDPKGLTHLAPVAVGLTYTVGQLMAIPLTGGSMNPARSFGPAVAANIWSDHWIYWLGPLIGAGIAAIVYEFVFLEREVE